MWVRAKETMMAPCLHHGGFIDVAIALNQGLLDCFLSYIRDTYVILNQLGNKKSNTETWTWCDWGTAISSNLVAGTPSCGFNSVWNMQIANWHLELRFHEMLTLKHEIDMMYDDAKVHAASHDLQFWNPKLRYSCTGTCTRLPWWLQQASWGQVWQQQQASSWHQHATQLTLLQKLQGV